MSRLDSKILVLLYLALFARSATCATMTATTHIPVLATPASVPVIDDEDRMMRKPPPAKAPAVDTSMNTVALSLMISRDFTSNTVTLRMMTSRDVSYTEEERHAIAAYWGEAQRFKTNMFSLAGKLLTGFSEPLTANTFQEADRLADLEPLGHFADVARFDVAQNQYKHFKTAHAKMTAYANVMADENVTAEVKAVAYENTREFDDKVVKAVAYENTRKFDDKVTAEAKVLRGGAGRERCRSRSCICSRRQRA